MTTYSHHAPHRPRAPRWAALLLLPLLVVAAGCGSAGSEAPAVGNSQMEFGVQMAQQGLWSEALFRFQQAERLGGGGLKIYNNLAVAYEANGLFDQALDSYKKALQVAPNNRELRRNYSRFIEFYQSFKPRDEAQDGAGKPPVEEGGPPGGG